jgi:toxin ParE1/3/4
VDYKVIIAPRAISDLRAIVQYISPDRPQAAQKLGLTLIEKTKALSVYPRSGKVVREFSDQNIRQPVLAPYRIIYRRDETARVVGIARLWHGAQADISSIELGETP